MWYMQKNEKILQVGVKVFLQNAEGKYLLLHRSSTKYPEVPNPWDIVGGRIEIGTPLLENLAREVKEETGLAILGAPRVVGAQDVLGVARFPERHVVRISYVAKTDGEPVLDMEENDEYKWLIPSEMLKLEGLDKYVRELVNQGVV